MLKCCAIVGNAIEQLVISILIGINERIAYGIAYLNYVF